VGSKFRGYESRSTEKFLRIGVTLRVFWLLDQQEGKHKKGTEKGGPPKGGQKIYGKDRISG